MLIPYWGGPGLVRAYSLELMVEAYRQHAVAKSQQPHGRYRAAFGRALLWVGSQLTELGDRLTARPGEPTLCRVAAEVA